MAETFFISAYVAQNWWLDQVLAPPLPQDTEISFSTASDRECWISCDWKWMDGSLYISTFSSALFSISKLFWAVCFGKSQFNFFKLYLPLQWPRDFRKRSHKTNCMLTSIGSRWLSTGKSRRCWSNELTEVHGDATSLWRMLSAHCSFLSCGDLYL